jgi:hypothetical protein
VALLERVLQLVLLHVAQELRIGKSELVFVLAVDALGECACRQLSLDPVLKRQERHPPVYLHAIPVQCAATFSES